MPFKVRCKLVGFVGDAKNFPCHFDYKIGDEFTYDGARFEGQICNGLLKNGMPVIWNTLFYGRGEPDKMIFLYSGLSARDPGMARYDGIGYRPLKKAPEGANENFLRSIPVKPPKNLIRRTPGFICDDRRTGAQFVCEPIGLANGGDMITYYKREMDILEKIKNEPGMTVEEILNKFTPFEREETYPPLYAVNVSLMLGEIAAVDYIEIRDGKAYAKNPPASSGPYK